MNVTSARTAPARSLAKHFERQQHDFADPTVAEKSAKWINEFAAKFKDKQAGWHDLATFWPPRCVEAFSENKATIFFGAGISLPAGFPSWHALLVEYFQLDQALVEDEDLKNDPLTLAELAGQVLGNESLQQRLREVFVADKKTTTSHRLLAALDCRVYVTTNYDTLLEKAFTAFGETPPFVATNDTHLADAVDIIAGKYQGPIPYRSVLFKIHGCVNKLDEHLILTRRDYRHHYRANALFFKKIIDLLLARHTLFVGFSHRDPEVSRLVDDAIHQFENSPDKRTAQWPQLYSLQFDMRAHTPEIFAARGIVALTPPPPKLDTEPKTIRSQALAAGLCDLILAKSLDFHKDADARLDRDLGEVVQQLEMPLNEGLRLLSSNSGDAERQIASGGSTAWLDSLCGDLGELAGQGVFLANEYGQIVACSLPGDLSADRKSQIINAGVSERPYFQIANSYRKAFVSDLAESIFNKHGTFFLCQPLLRDGRFTGLIFSAAQVGLWMIPVKLAEEAWSRNRGFVLVDSNGVCLIPAFGEFGLSSVAWDPIAETAAAANEGYPFKRLLGLSRRDQLVRHIAKSVVPVQQDDDVLVLAKDSGYYTVVSELTNTRWKIALSMPMSR
jgi:SIR2-like domain